MPAKSYARKKDVNPQWLNLALATETVVNTYAESSTATPCIQSLNNGRALVMEILKVYWYVGHPDMINIVDASVDVRLLKKSQSAMVYANNADVIDGYGENVRSIDSAATDATLILAMPKMPDIHDLTDGQGNGYLFGGKTLTVGIKGTANANQKAAICKVLYRLIEVDATELIGIIQE